ncbi:MAG: glycosyltransferase family 2 protein [bacterium]|nr:glycosyltransferase family 2 protein [bacterium]
MKQKEESKVYDLSIVILSFNVKELLLNCLRSIYENKDAKDSWQVMVVDNGSSDNSLEAVKKAYPRIESYQTGQNLGFSKGNNYTIPFLKAPAVLFLNPDTKIVGDVIQKSLDLLNSDPQIGALTCRVELPNGKLDYSCHRGFPTPWNSLTYFLGLAKRFPKLKLFSGYTATYLDINTTHEMECGSGTFLMVKRDVGDKIGWWDSDYFWNGEDIEFFYQVKELGYKTYYYAGGKVIHYKGSSSGLQSTSQAVVPKERKITSAKHATEAMRIFFMKHYYHQYFPGLREFILLGIYLLEKMRILKINSGLKYE